MFSVFTYQNAPRQLHGPSSSITLTVFNGARTTPSSSHAGIAHVLCILYHTFARMSVYNDGTQAHGGSETLTAHVARDTRLRLFSSSRIDPRAVVPPLIIDSPCLLKRIRSRCLRSFECVSIGWWDILPDMLFQTARSSRFRCHS